ncbi:MAG: NTP transferase domain-containing protein [Desulfurococcales archaeon]|nr:NTP transferase domain-containing protein [Desulfurococcales archaeon]
MISILLAAGESRRFQKESGTHKLSVRIRGIPLICYPITSLSLAGIKEVIIITSYTTEPLVRESIIQCPYMSGFSYIKIDTNKEVWRDNGYTMLLGIKDVVPSSLFIVSMSDHLYPVDIPIKLKGLDNPCIGADSNPRFIDVLEATKIHVKRGGIILGKNLEEYMYVDVGVHLLGTNISYTPCTNKYVLKMSELLSCIYNEYFQIIDFRGIAWMDIDTLRDYINAVSGPAKRVVDMVISGWEMMGIKIN